MLKKDLCNSNLPRPEYDQRAREARLRQERVERLFGRRPLVVNRRPFQLRRILGFGLSENGRRGDRSTGSPGERRPCDIPVLIPIGTVVCVPG